MFAIASAVAFALFSSVAAQPSPLTPLAAQAGGNCVITWTPDTTGSWTQTNIELMSGDNINMVHLTTVTTVDTTSGSPATFTWTCPEVTLYSAVYFYQFSHALQPSALLWTTRWAIESSTGSVVPPPNATQPNGEAVAWGLGELVDPSTAKAAPAYITGETSATGGATASNTTATGSSSASMPSTMVSSMTTMLTPTTVKATTTSLSLATPTTTTSATVTSTSTSGAGGLRSPGSLIVAAAGAVFAGCVALM